MRPQTNKRGRSRGRKGSHQANRTLESNGPDVKIRGTASHIYEKYQALARDANSSGDRVGAENYLQHAEHYFRLMAASQAASPNPSQPHQHAVSNGHAYETEGEEISEPTEARSASAAPESVSTEEETEAEPAEGEKPTRRPARLNGRSRRVNGRGGRAIRSLDGAEGQAETGQDSGGENGAEPAEDVDEATA